MLHGQADIENRPVYLESTTEANNAYYRKFGFEVKRDISLDRGSTPVRLFIMVREPRLISKVTYTVGATAPIKMFRTAGVSGKTVV
jgi:hypothetical protein